MFTAVTKRVLVLSQEGIPGYTKPQNQSQASSKFSKVRKKNTLPKS